MLLGSRRVLVENLVTDVDRRAALNAIASVTRTELTSVLRAMDGVPLWSDFSTRRCTSSCPT